MLQSHNHGNISTKLGSLMAVHVLFNRNKWKTYDMNTPVSQQPGSAHLNYGLAEEIIALPGQLLPQFGLDVVVLVPHSHLDSVAGVVTLAAGAVIELGKVTSDN